MLQCQLVVPANEQGAGFMAAGYARASGKVGVVMVTSGPGATNTVTPVRDSMADSDPDGRDHVARSRQRPRSAQMHSRKHRYRGDHGCRRQTRVPRDGPGETRRNRCAARSNLRAQASQVPVVDRYSQGRAELGSGPFQGAMAPLPLHGYRNRRRRQGYEANQSQRRSL